ncbi:hypothetical protein Tco_1115884 [Tanacetum coccineum]
MNAVPSSPSHLPKPLLIVKEVYIRKAGLPDSLLMTLLIHIKSACQAGWYTDEDKDCLLIMVDKASLGYYNLDNGNDEPTNGYSVSEIISRFYPRMRVEQILASFDVKAGERKSVAVMMGVPLWCFFFFTLVVICRHALNLVPPTVGTRLLARRVDESRREGKEVLEIDQYKMAHFSKKIKGMINKKATTIWLNSIFDDNDSLDVYSRSDITALAKDKTYTHINLEEITIHQASTVFSISLPFLY